MNKKIAFLLLSAAFLNSSTFAMYKTLKVLPFIVGGAGATWYAATYEKRRNSKLYHAIRKCNLKQFKKLAKKRDLSGIKYKNYPSKDLNHFPAIDATLLIALINICPDTKEGLEFIKHAIKKGANINAPGNNKGHLEDLDGLFGLGSISPLLYACQINKTKIAKELIKNNADVNFTSFDKNPLFWAIKHGNYELTKTLLENKANLNMKQEYTPLHIAAMFNRPKITKLLLKYGANSNGKDNPIIDLPPKTALQEALNNSSWVVAKVLIDNGANCDTKTKKGILENYNKFISLELDKALNKILIENGIDCDTEKKKHFYKHEDL
jgi:ankyrin repeat protein